MARQHRSIDGFIASRSQYQPKNAHTKKRAHAPVPQEPPVPHRKASVSRSAIDHSLREIDQPARSRRHVTSRRRLPIRRVLVFAVICILVGAGYVGVQAMQAGGKVFKGNILGLIEHTPLRMDSNGRSNILILGTSQDDPGHQGGNLTDSMMILSVDQNKKNAYMISIPRDLYVKYGRACDSGYVGKINAYYDCVHDGKTGADADKTALAKSAEFISAITGLDLQYGVNVDYTVMRDAVNAVGGSITVDIEGDGAVPYGVKPGSVMDSNFDWKCGVGDRKVTHTQVLQRCPPNGHFIDYAPGPQVLDAEHVLYLAQARGDAAPTYGLAQSNFDRERNQQKIVKAIREKAASGGLLTNIASVTSVIDSIGDNLRTTFDSSEIQTLVDIAKNTKDGDIKSLDLNSGDSPIMTTGMIAGQSVVEPSAGSYDYSGLQAFLAKHLSNNPVTQEGALIEVVNASGVAGVAQQEADKLKAQGFVTGAIANASGSYPAVSVYQVGTGDTATAAQLKTIYHTVPLTTKVPFSVAPDAHFVVILGQTAKSSP